LYKSQVERKERKCISNVCKYETAKVARGKEWKASNLKGVLALY